MVFVKSQIRLCKVIFGHTDMTKMPNKLSTSSFWYFNTFSFSQAHCMYVQLFVHELISPTLLSTLSFWHFMLSFSQAHRMQLEIFVKQLISSTLLNIKPFTGKSFVNKPSILQVCTVKHVCGSFNSPRKACSAHCYLSKQNELCKLPAGTNSSTNLSTQIRDDDELLQHVLGQNVGVARLLDVVGGHVDVVGTQVQVGGGNGTHSPLSLGGEGLRLVVAGGGGDDLVAVLVDGDGGCCRQLRLFLGLLLNLGDLLALGGGRRDFHSQDDVTDFRLCQRGHVHAVRKHDHDQSLMTNKSVWKSNYPRCSYSLDHNTVVGK